MVEELFHHGIKGQKWGVRRTKKQIESASEDATTADALKTRAKISGTHALTNSELKTAIERMNLERQYDTLITQTTPKTLGQRFVKFLLGDIAKEQATRVAKGAASIEVEKALRSQGRGDIADRIKPKKK